MDTLASNFKSNHKLDVVGKVVKADMGPNGDEAPSPIVIAVIARNPFYRKASVPKELSETGKVSARQLVENELLLCSLRDWHDRS